MLFFQSFNVLDISLFQWLIDSGWKVNRVKLHHHVYKTCLFSLNFGLGVSNPPALFENDPAREIQMIYQYTALSCTSCAFITNLLVAFLSPLNRQRGKYKVRTETTAREEGEVAWKDLLGICSRGNESGGCCVWWKGCMKRMNGICVPTQHLR